MVDTRLAGIAGLEVRYPRFTLGPLSFAVHAGDVICLVGLNASGKTTLLRTLAGRLDHYSGSVVVAGIEVARFPAAVRATVGFVPDRLPAAPAFRVRDYLAFLRRFHPEWDHAYAEGLCARLAVDGQARMGSLSRGTRTKVALIAAEAFRPPILALDEPTSGLDLRARETFLEVVTEAMAAAPSRAVIFSTHVMDDAQRLATRVFALQQGSLRPDIALSEVPAFITDGAVSTTVPARSVRAS